MLNSLGVCFYFHVMDAVDMTISIPKHSILLTINYFKIFQYLCFFIIIQVGILLFLYRINWLITKEHMHVFTTEIHYRGSLAYWLHVFLVPSARFDVKTENFVLEYPLSLIEQKTQRRKTGGTTKNKNHLLLAFHPHCLD